MPTCRFPATPNTIAFPVSNSCSVKALVSNCSCQPCGGERRRLRKATRARRLLVIVFTSEFSSSLSAPSRILFARVAVGGVALLAGCSVLTPFLVLAAPAPAWTRRRSSRAE